VVVAIGSSFPELSATVLSTSVHGNFELGLAVIIGSAIFNILVIPGLSGLVSKEPLESNRDLVYKEAQFYMISVAVLLLTFSFATIYNPLEGERLLGQMDRKLAMLPLCLYALYLFLQWQDTVDHEPESTPAAISVGKEWLRFGASLVVILVGVEALVRAALGFGELFGTPAFFWGVTVVAAGTSVPDTFVSVRAAQQGNAVTCLANVFGSNIFDLLVCIPVGVLIAGATTVDYAVAVPMMGFLTLATLVLFTFMRIGMAITKTECKVLLLIYLLFVIGIAL
jgi:cation:H+ antiporter